MNAAVLKLWKRLYDAARDVESLDPWRNFTGLAGVEEADSGEVYWFWFVGGRRHEIYACAGTRGLRAILEPEKDVGEYKTLCACFGYVPEVSDEEREFAAKMNEKLGYEIMFRSIEPGYMPWNLSDEEAALFTELLLQLKCALEDQIHLEEGQALLRSFDGKSWVSGSVKVELPPEEAEAPLIIRDDLLLARILKRPRVDARLELDTFRVLIAVEDEGARKPYFPVMAMLADSVSGAIVEFGVLSPEQNAAEHSLELVTSFIEKHGRPLVIYLENPKLNALLCDALAEMRIPLELVNFLPSINAFKLEKGIVWQQGDE